jgi:MarR family transcriptional regulator for hemolysin
MSRAATAEGVTNPPPLNLRRGIGLKMAVLARQMRQRFDQRVEEMGVTRAKYILIATVANNPGCTQREIAAKLEMSDVTAGRMIDRVCADGLIERQENPQDRRAYRVCLTDAAQPVLKKLAAAASAYEEEMFSSMDQAELETLNALLDKLASHISHARRELSERKAVSLAMSPAAEAS